MFHFGFCVMKTVNCFSLFAVVVITAAISVVLFCECFIYPAGSWDCRLLVTLEVRYDEPFAFSYHKHNVSP